MRKKKKVVYETTEKAIARGMVIQRFEEGKVSKRELKKRQKEFDKTEQVDLRLLMTKCNPEQKKKLLEIAKEQGIFLEEEK